jgi:U4/U6.U5 tri-snRNP-associated protein 1
MEESISLEETNKIRISLGLKPLTDDSAPAVDKDKEAEDNYTKRREQEAKDREAKYVRSAHSFHSQLTLLSVYFIKEN